MSTTIFEDVPVPIRLKLSALWASVMFCFIYADFFGLFVPGRLMAMNAGLMKPLGAATPTVLLTVSAMIAIPSALVALSLLLPVALSRWANIVFGLLYTAIMVLTSMGAPPFYILFATVEIAMLLTLVVLAAKWRKLG